MIKPRFMRRSTEYLTLRPFFQAWKLIAFKICSWASDRLEAVLDSSFPKKSGRIGVLVLSFEWKSTQEQEEWLRSAVAELL